MKAEITGAMRRNIQVNAKAPVCLADVLRVVPVPGADPSPRANHEIEKDCCGSGNCADDCCGNSERASMRGAHAADARSESVWG